MKLAKWFGDAESIKKYLINSYNTCEGIEIRGKTVGIADYYQAVKKNLERFARFLAQTDKGEGTIISCTVSDGASEITVLTEIVEITGLSPFSSIFYRGKAEFNEALKEKFASYNSHPHLSHCCWCTLDYVIPPGNSTALLTSSKKLEKISEEELRKFEQSLKIKEGLLTELRNLYAGEKKRKIFEVEKIYV